MFLKFKKTLSIALILILLFTKALTPVAVYAQVADPTVDSSSVTPTETPTPTPDPTTTSSDLILTETPTPAPDPTPIESGPTTTIDNVADVTNNLDTTAITGENEISATDSAEVLLDNVASLPPASQDSSTASVNTGDSVSVSTAENNINSTSVNSKIVYQTINIFADQSGNIDLTTPTNVINSILNVDKKTDPVINVTIISNENYAYLSNDIVSVANTGGNSVAGADTAYVNTGNAYSAISLLNKVNLTVINSELHLITINIFGKLSGNIILPDQTINHSPCSNCSYPVDISNIANVENNVSSTAVTGQNKIEGNGLTAIQTGDALAVSNILNLVNSNYIGVNLTNLEIINYGNWQGSFLGWGDLVKQNALGGVEITSLGSECATCGGGGVNVNNYAEILNNISSSANTGGNDINANSATIRTGNAVSQVSLFNLVNSNFIGTNAFFAFINIFGDWTGDIGGASEFAALNPEPSNDSIKSTSDQSVREDGGLLEVSQSNNVGEHVLPGDTVTFFIKVKNPGKGKLYETKLRLTLLKDGEEVGGTIFDLGVIEQGKSFKVTTGLVLSKLAPGGKYVARATAAGLTGQDNKELFASADSDFKIFGNGFAGLSSGEESQKINKMVLGTIAKPENKTKAKNDQAQKLYLLLILTAYTGIKVVKKRKIVAELFAAKLPVKVRLYTLRSILL